MKVTTADGWTLSVQVHGARGPAQGVVLALHAMMADARSLDRPAGAGLATTLANAGLEVWRADLRGHGQSGPTPAEGGRWTYDDLVEQDLPALVAAARDRGLPVTVLGHSLGGHVAAAAATQGLQVDALVLLAANVWLPSTEPSRRRRWQKSVAVRAFRHAVVGGRFPARRLRLGPAEESGPYVRDLCRFWELDRWASRAGVDWGAALSSIRVPVLSVVGAGDHLLAHPVAVRHLWDGIGAAAVDTWLAGRGQFELDFDPGHAAVGCDPRCAGLWGAMAAWILKRPARSGGWPDTRGGYPAAHGRD